MRHILRSAVLGLVLSSTVAGAMPLYRDRFVHEKSGFVVETRSLGGTLRLTGRHPSTGSTFRLKVSSAGRVTGDWNGAPVSFVMNEAKGPTELAVASMHAGNVK